MSMLSNDRDYCKEFKENQDRIYNALCKLYNLYGKNLKKLAKQYRIISVSTVGNGFFIFDNSLNSYVFDSEADYGFRHLVDYENFYPEENGIPLKFQWVIK